MQTLRPEEEWARRTVASTLGLPVTQHDDGTAESMHDLDIQLADGSTGVVEVVAAADGERIALWKLVNPPGDPWVDRSLIGGWFASLRPDAVAKVLLQGLPGLLGSLEAAGVREIDFEAFRPSAFDAAAEALGIRHLRQSATSVPGSCYFTIEPDEGFGLWADPTGTALSDWVGQFLRHADQADVLRKLARPRAAERHAFLIVPGFTTAPNQVEYQLLSEAPVLPTEAPDLPDEVTHVWGMSTWNSKSGLRWDAASGWTVFDKLLDNAA